MSDQHADMSGTSEQFRHPPLVGYTRDSNSGQFIHICMGTEGAHQTSPVGTRSDSSDTLDGHSRAVDLVRRVFPGAVVISEDDR